MHLYPQIKKNYYRSDLKTLISTKDSEYVVYAYLDTNRPKYMFVKGKIRGP